MRDLLKAQRGVMMMSVMEVLAIMATLSLLTLVALPALGELGKEARAYLTAPGGHWPGAPAGLPSLHPVPTPRPDGRRS